jgi:hypothetical protein
MTVPELYSRVVELRRDARALRRPRWVLSRAHVQAFVDEENERRAKERQRLPLDLERWEAGEIQLMGWPVRIADVDEIGVEDMSPDVLIENWRQWSAARDADSEDTEEGA